MRPIITSSISFFFVREGNKKRLMKNSLFVQLWILKYAESNLVGALSPPVLTLTRTNSHLADESVIE